MRAVKFDKFSTLVSKNYAFDFAEKIYGVKLLWGWI